MPRPSASWTSCSAAEAMELLLHIHPPPLHHLSFVRRQLRRFTQRQQSVIFRFANFQPRAMDAAGLRSLSQNIQQHFQRRLASHSFCMNRAALAHRELRVSTEAGARRFTCFARCLAHRGQQAASHAPHHAVHTCVSLNNGLPQRRNVAASSGARSPHRIPGTCSLHQSSASECDHSVNGAFTC